MDTIMFLMTCLLGGTFAGGAFELIKSIWLWRLNRKAAKEDNAAELAEKLKLSERVGLANEILEIKSAISKLVLINEDLRHGEMAILHDRIKYICLQYIKVGTISVDELHNVNIMFAAYEKLGGNGTLHILVEQVRLLPIRPE